MLERTELARIVDHTLLAPTATLADVEALASEAAELDTYSICVSPSMLPLPFSPRVKVATVCGFPSGKHTPAAKAAEAAGADFVKTSTGFHPSGGASEHAVALMAQTVGGRLGVKASGGIRDWDAAQAMVAAGATRLGLSGTRAVLDGGTSEGY